MYHRIPLPLGSEQRSNPLPPGTYWVDVFGANRSKMASWAQSNHGAVQVLSTQTTGTDDSDPNTYDEYTFKVTSPVPWDAVTFGYPEITVEPPPTAAAPGSPSASPAPLPASASAPKAPISSNMTALVIGALAVIGLTITVAVLHKRRAA